MLRSWTALLTCLIPAAAAADAEEARSFLGDRSGTIAVVNRALGDRLYVLDLDDGILRPIGEEMLIHSPLVSPDGTRIAYSQVAKVYIQPLDGGERTFVVDGYDPHWWLDAAGDEWLYYDTPGDRSYEAEHGNFRWPNAEGVEAHRLRLRDGLDEWLLDYKGDGGPSPDGTHLGAGAASMLLFNLVTGEHSLLYGGALACNPSISPDDRHLLMFLSSSHQSFMIRDWDDDVVWELTLPDDLREWTAPEWSNDPDYAAVIGRGDNRNGAVYIVRISTGERLRVLDGTAAEDWYWPYLHVDGVPPYPWPDTEPAPEEEAAAEEEEPPRVGGVPTGGCAAVSTPLALLALARRRPRRPSRRL